MLIVAHRGASAQYPEQTAAAIRAAWAQGADGLEVDLRLTRDRRLLLHHDATLARCCGDPRRVGLLDARERLSLNACHGRPDLPAEPPLLLEEALELVPADRLLMLELKEGPEQVAPLAAALAAGRDGLLLISFNLATLREAHARLPRLPALWLRRGRRPVADSTQARWIRAARREGLAGLDLATELVTSGLADQLAGAGLELGAWTVDDPDRARQLRGLGLRWLTTNRPGELRAALG